MMCAALTVVLALSGSVLLTPPDDLRAAASAVADARRSVPERRAALARSITLRRELLQVADANSRSQLALDQIESLVLVGPSLDATDAFALAGLLEADDATSLAAALDDATVLLASLRDSNASAAARKSILATILAARRVDLAAQRGERLNVSASTDDSVASKLTSPARETLRLALARIALVSRPAEAASLVEAVATAADAPILLRTAARALALIGRAERGEADVENGIALLLDSTVSLETPSRLLIGDALARIATLRQVAPTDAVLAWEALLATARKADAATLRAAVIRRVRTLLSPPSLDEALLQPPLVLAAFAPELSRATPDEAQN